MPVKKSADNFEFSVVMKWFTRIGILAIVLGFVWFFKYAIDNGWISPLYRVLIGVVIGLLLILFGEISSKMEKYLVLGKTLVGGGIAITYFSVYVSYYFQSYREAIGISQPFAIILLSLVVIFSIILSLKDNSKIIAIESFSLGFITSLFGGDFSNVTLIYNLFLTLGLVLVVCIKKWYSLSIASVILTYLLYLPWVYSDSYNFGLAITFLCFYFFVFSVQSFFADKDNSAQNTVATLFNGLLFFVLSLSQIRGNYPQYDGIYVFLVGFVFLILATIHNVSKMKEIYAVNFALALFSLIIAIPLQFDKLVVTFIWGLEVLIFAYIGLKQDIELLRISSFILGFLLAYRVIFFDFWSLEGQIAGISLYAISAFVCAIVLYLSAFMIRKNGKNSTQRVIRNIYIGLASFIMLLFINEVFSTEWKLVGATFFLLVLTLFYVNIKEDTAIVISAHIIAGVIAFSAIFLAPFYLEGFNGLASLLENTLLISLLFVCAVYYLCAFVWSRLSDGEGKGAIETLYLIVANFVLVELIFIELSGFYISIALILVGLFCLFIGIASAWKSLRVQALVILFLAILKIFLYDAFNLAIPFRILSFISLGVILLVIVWIYSKYANEIKKFISD